VTNILTLHSFDSRGPYLSTRGDIFEACCSHDEPDTQRYLVIYVLGALGVALPPKVLQIIWISVMLIVVLMIVRKLLPGNGTMRPLGLMRPWDVPT
jgi:hypothetical protein